MTIGILSDAHGNIYGLKKCLRLLEEFNVDDIFSLGDAVNYFSKSKEVLEFLRCNEVKCIKGNHEIMLLEDKPVPLEAKELCNLDFTRGTLGKDDYTYMDSWKDYIELDYGDSKILMVHASPFDYFGEYIYPDSDFSKFLDLKYDMIFMGHTHIPFLKNIGGKIIANVGSAGFSRDDGRFISCMVLDITQKKAKILRDKFPLEFVDDLRPFHKGMFEVLERRIK